MNFNKKIACLSLLILPTIASADMLSAAGDAMGNYTLDCPHWYVSGNLGVSHLYDKQAPGSHDSVNENGPGWNVNGGYQWNSILGGELGYTQYHDSRETKGGLNIAKTEHYAVHVAATGQYPLANQFSVVGKLGVAYSYANKIFTASGAAAASGSVSPYAALGVAYSITKKADFVAQWEGVRGNNYTGSSTLYSLGFKFAIV